MAVTPTLSVPALTYTILTYPTAIDRALRINFSAAREIYVPANSSQKSIVINCKGVFACERPGNTSTSTTSLPTTLAQRAYQIVQDKFQIYTDQKALISEAEKMDASSGPWMVDSKYKGHWVVVSKYTLEKRDTPVDAHFRTIWEIFIERSYSARPKDLIINAEQVDFSSCWDTSPRSLIYDSIRLPDSLVQKAYDIAQRKLNFKTSQESFLSEMEPYLKLHALRIPSSQAVG